MTEAENGVTLPQVKELQEPPEIRRSKEKSLPSILQKEYTHADTLILDFWPPKPWENVFLLY